MKSLNIAGYFRDAIRRGKYVNGEKKNRGITKKGRKRSMHKEQK
jgi:hypothetical protein